MTDDLPHGVTAEQLDRLTRAMYDAKAGSARGPMDDARWERVKANFASSVRICRDEVLAQIESGEIEL